MPYISVSGDTSVHGGAPLTSGLSADVFAGDKAVALVGSGSSSPDSQYDARNRPVHSAANQTADKGSTTVFVNNKALHRVNDARKEGTTSGPGISTILVGGPGGGGPAPEPGPPPGASYPEGSQPAGLIGAFDPTKFAPNPNGPQYPPITLPGAVPGKDYAYREIGGYAYLINLSSFTPTATEHVPSAYGDTTQGITRTWNIPGLPEGSQNFQTLQPAPLAVVNPELNAYNQLSRTQQFEIINGYCTQYNLNFLVSGGDAGPTASPGYAESSAFRTYLANNGITGPGDTTGEFSPPGT
jgi:hypothetical protein